MRIVDLKGTERPDWLHPMLPMHKETAAEEQRYLRRAPPPLTSSLHTAPWLFCPAWR